jgi:hypothetical protein
MNARTIMLRYLSAERRTTDDFGQPFTNETGEYVYDAKTTYGAWATMTQKSFDEYGLKLLGVGYGQRYRRNEYHHLLKVEYSAFDVMKLKMEAGPNAPCPFDYEPERTDWTKA